MISALQLLNFEFPVKSKDETRQSGGDLSKPAKRKDPNGGDDGWSPSLRQAR